MPDFAEILGYPETTVNDGLVKLKIPQAFFQAVLKKLQEDNNGYRYSYQNKVTSVYNPAKINYCFFNMQETLKREEVKKAISDNNLQNFMKFLFEFPENNNTRPLKSTLSALCKIKNSDKIIFKILNNSNKLDLKEAIDGPHLSYWDFTEEIQLISYLYYSGALTYAPYSLSDQYVCSVKIPNKCAEREYFDILKCKIEESTNRKMEIALKNLFDNDDISPLLNEIEQFYIENTKTPDIAQSREDGTDWSIYILLKNYLGKQIERQTSLKNVDDHFKTFYDDLRILPSSHPQKIFLIEEKNISFDKMTMGLNNYFIQKEIYPELVEKSWEKLFEVYKKLFFDEKLKLSEDQLSQINIQHYDIVSQEEVKISFANYLVEPIDIVSSFFPIPRSSGYIQVFSLCSLWIIK